MTHAPYSNGHHVEHPPGTTIARLEEVIPRVKQICDSAGNETIEGLELQRLMAKILLLLEEQKLRLHRLPRKSGFPWSSEEERDLEGLFESNTSIREIANLLDRSQAAVAARLVKLGKLSPEDAPNYRYADPVKGKF